MGNADAGRGKTETCFSEKIPILISAEGSTAGGKAFRVGRDRITTGRGIGGMSTNSHFDFSHLTPAERIQLAIDLWDSVDPGTADWPLTDAERAELARRLDTDDLGADVPWDQVRDEALRKLGVSVDDPERGRV